MPINHSVRPEIMDSVALLVIDAQDCFIETLHDKETFLKRTAFAIEAARCLKLHTIFTEQVPDKLGRTNSTLFKLANKPRMFAKTSFSALNAPGMERFLRDNEIYHLLIVGLETPICIYQTGLQATEEDVDVTFFTDALGSRRPEDTAPVLDTLTRMGCQALPSEAVFYSLMGDTACPYFRDFTKIVKAFGAADFSIENYLENRPEFVEIEAPKKERPEENNQREQRDNRRDNNRDRNRSERPRRERRDEDSEDKEPIQEERAERDNRRDNNRSEDGEERRQHKRGRRRRGGRNRNREERDGPREDRRDSEKPAAPRPEQSSKPSESKAPTEPKKESPKPAKAKPAKTEKPEATEKPAVAKKAPAKKATKKVAKKVVKKVAKKAAKKIARKTAKKVAKKSDDA